MNSIELILSFNVSSFLLKKNYKKTIIKQLMNAHYRRVDVIDGLH